MPYTRETDRNKFDDIVYDKGITEVKDLASYCSSPGDLNYLVTSLCDKYIKDRGLSYTNVNEVIGVLECAKLELYRRVAAPYEDTKIIENGDVYSKENLVR